MNRYVDRQRRSAEEISPHFPRSGRLETCPLHKTTLNPSQLRVVYRCELPMLASVITKDSLPQTSHKRESVQSAGKESRAEAGRLSLPDHRQAIGTINGGRADSGGPASLSSKKKFLTLKQAILKIALPAWMLNVRQCVAIYPEVI